MTEHKTITIIQRKPKPSRKAKHIIRLERTTGDLLARAIPIFPARSKPLLLTYATELSITSGAGLAGTHVFSANGMYDPDITSTGHQPMGFDQLMLWYEHYTVIRAKITAHFRNFSSSYAAFAAISLNGSATPVTNYGALQENGMVKRAICTPKYNTGYMKTLNRVMDIKEFSGVGELLSEFEMRGTSGSNPQEQEYFHLSVWNPDDSTTISVIVTVTMEFEAVFSEPRKLTQS